MPQSHLIRWMFNFDIWIHNNSTEALIKYYGIQS